MRSKGPSNSKGPATASLACVLSLGRHDDKVPTAAVAPAAIGAMGAAMRVTPAAIGARGLTHIQYPYL